MKTALWLSPLLCLASLPAPARGDPLDDLIAQRRNGAAASDPQQEQKTLQLHLGKASAAYRTALVNDYLAQVKASIVDGQGHGGWPYRSTLVYMASTRRVLTSGLKSRFEFKPDAMLAYALICPAIYAQDDALLNRALDYLRKNDAFLFEHAHQHMGTYWLPFISDVLKRQKATVKDLKEKDDPFSVLPR